MHNIIGYDPGKDDLIGPHQIDVKTLNMCDGCGHCISESERFYQLVLHKDFVILCEDCYSEIIECIAEYN